ncbi:MULTISPECIES: hypothetical protein [Flavobacterium]|uniref:hypothetical protein n=1 Tax=Flavobacterium TaxID=237 RepID=UPI001FCB57F9|nr:MULTISPECIES: hypothetical protein [Flavobacterium]UOK43577.1 hypothetical protein LZF87_05500 [Flavobacterium enshiense]
MKRLLLVFMLIFSGSIFANDFQQNFEAAMQFKKEANYQKAAKYFLKALKEKEDEKYLAQSLCFEISDCFLKAGDEKSALKFVKIAVRNYGATLEDIMTTKILRKDFLANVSGLIDVEYQDLRRIYLLKNDKFDKKEYVEMIR